MILSHKHKFIFLKTTKTAGTSIELWLAKYCGLKDIITTLSERDEEKRAEFGAKAAGNYIINLEQEKFQINSHISANKLKKILANTGQENIWNEYYKFAFERNPWDRVVSAFLYLRAMNKLPLNKTLSAEFQGQNEKSVFNDFLMATDNLNLHNLKKRGKGLYSIKENIAVDKVYKYEDLAKAITDITTRVGIKAESTELPRTKVRQNKLFPKAYRRFYTANNRKLVQDFFMEEIDRMDYTF